MSTSNLTVRGGWIGLLVTISIFISWFSSLILLLSVQISCTDLIWIIFAVLGRSILHTGLFIIAHDAMHINLIPHKRVNNILGSIAVFFYAFLSYRQCCLNHKKHHRHPAQIGDPDFHDGIHRHPVLWYLKFIKEYLPIRLLIAFLIHFCFACFVLNQLLHISFVNLLLFWILPLCLSSIQLFFFGTYLPHRGNGNVPHFPHYVQRSKIDIFWSFLTCYHFGSYHWEHHQYPKIPWYRLPTIHGSRSTLIF